MNIEATTRRKGNVARLPKPLRDTVNAMLDDGFTYKQIIAELEKSQNPPLPHPISEDSLSRWNHGGYQDYLQTQDRRERMTILSERFLDPAESDPIQLAAGALHGAMIQVCECMDQITQAKPGETDPQNFVRVANALSRMTRSIVIISEYRDELQRLKAADPASKEAQAKARQDMLDKMDQLFGIRPSAALDRIFGPLDGRDDQHPLCGASSPVVPSRASSSEDSNLKSELPTTDNDHQTTTQ